MQERFQLALHAVVADLEAMPEVTGILFFGSASRNEATPTSDLDLYAVTNGDQMWTSGRLVHGVEVELHFANVRAWKSRMAGRKAVVTHAFATGRVLLDRTGETTSLVEMGKQIWSEGPNAPKESQIEAYRYHLSDLTRDLEDVASDSPEARLLGGQLVPMALEVYCALHRVWTVKARRWIPYLREIDPQLAQQVHDYYSNGQAAQEAIAIADAVLQPFGGRIVEYERKKLSC